MSDSPLFIAYQEADLFPEQPRHPLVEPSLFYDPSYDRPLDDDFAWHLVKYLQPISGLLYREPVTLPHAEVELDFIIEHGPRRVGIAITRDGDFEDEDTMLLQDALLVASGALDVLFRVRAEDVARHLHDALFLMARVEPGLFSQRGRVNLHTLATPAARRAQPQRGEATLAVPADDGAVVHWLSTQHPEVWLPRSEHALDRFGITPDVWSRHWAKSA